MKFLPLLKPYTGVLLLAGLASLILIIFGIISSFYSRYIIDEIIFTNASLTLMTLSVGMLGLVIFQSVLTAVRSFLLTNFAFKIDLTLILSYFNHVLRLPLAFFDSRKTGEILSRLRDAQRIRAVLSQTVMSVVLDTLLLFIVGPILFTINSTMFLILILAVPLASIVILIFSHLYKQSFRKLMIEGSEVQSYLVESVNGIATVKALNSQDLVFREYEKRQMKAVNTGYQTGKISIFQAMSIDIIQGLSSNILFWVGSTLIMNNIITLGTLISFNALAAYFIGPLQRLIGLQSGLQEAFVAADRLGEILELQVEQNNDSRWIRPNNFAGSIRFQNLSFRYGTRQPVYKNLSFTIEPGQWIAFTGASGCGKTTLVKLLLKFYQPDTGEIFIDNHNIIDLDTEHLRSKVGYVPQEVFLFSGSIADNIALHHPNASLEEIIAAAEKTGAHDFIIKLPDRYKTILGERGATLSGGERQRLALARALLGKPEILIFDEATSNLDSMSEQLIHSTIENLRGERITTILIAHRLSTVTNCDQIFVLDEGRIVEQGTHKQLLEKKGLYHSLWGGCLI